MDTLLREKLKSAISRFPYWDLQSNDRLNDFYTRTASDFFIMDHNKFHSNFEEKAIDEISNSSSDSYNRDTFDFSRAPTTIIVKTSTQEPPHKHHTDEIYNTTSADYKNSTNSKHSELSDQEAIKDPEYHLESSRKYNEDQAENSEEPKNLLHFTETGEELRSNNEEFLNSREADFYSHEAIQSFESSHSLFDKSKHHSINHGQLPKEAKIKNETIQYDEEEINYKVSDEIANEEIDKDSHKVSEKIIDDASCKNQFHNSRSSREDLGDPNILPRAEEEQREISKEEPITENDTLINVSLHNVNSIPVPDDAKDDSQSGQNLKSDDGKACILEDQNTSLHEELKETVIIPDQSSPEKETLAKHDDEKLLEKFKSQERDDSTSNLNKLDEVIDKGEEIENLTVNSEIYSKSQGGKGTENHPKKEEKVNHYGTGSLAVGTPINKKENEHPPESCCSKCQLL